MAYGNSFTSYDALLKEYYSDEAVTNSIYMDNPFLAMIKKFENSVGRHFVEPIIYGAGQGRSGDFTRAQTLAGLTGELSADFLLTRVENHAVANVDSQTIAATGSDKGAFLKAVSLIADNQLQNLANDLSLGLYGSSDGNRGQLSASQSLSATVITLKNAKDAMKFEVGMELMVSGTKTGALRALGSAGHGLYVSKVDVKAGTLQIATTPVVTGTAVAINDATDGIPTIAASDYLFVRGDQSNKMSGFQSWIPSSAVASNDSFFGVNRSVHQVRLAGNYLDGTGGTLEEVLEQACADVGEQGGSLTHFFMPFKKFADLSRSLGAKAQLVDVVVNPQIGFKGIQVVGTKGAVTCIPDRSCDSTMIAGVNIKDWQLNSVGKAAHVWDEDGKVWLRSSSASGMEIRFYSLSQVLCKQPRNQINITVNA